MLIIVILRVDESQTTPARHTEEKLRELASLLEDIPEAVRRGAGIVEQGRELRARSETMAANDGAPWSPTEEDLQLAVVVRTYHLLLLFFFEIYRSGIYSGANRAMGGVSCFPTKY